MTVMTAEPRILRTKAEDGLIAEYEAARMRLPGDEAVLTRRDKAFAAFEKSGLPHRRVEAWKYTDLRSMLKALPPPAGEAMATDVAALAKGDPLAGLDRARVVITNGVYRPELSDLGGLAGVAVESIADVFAKSPERVGRLFADISDAVVALNTAMAAGGVFVSVARDAAPERPIEIAHLTAGGSPSSVYLRNVVEVGANAAIRIIESHRGTPDVAHLVNSASELEVGQGANVWFIRLQAESDAATHLASFAARIGQDARFDHLTVNAGAALSRWQGFVTVAGTGAEVAFHGATMLSGREHGDMVLEVAHAVPYGRSRELYKSVVDDDAFGAFQGRIVVKPDAQKTDAKMMTQALLLSDAAQFAAKPELEIFADDVQCGHGATSGRIDQTQLFYLMARGVPRAEAERLLIEAFLADPIDAIGDEKIAGALKGTIATWLARRRRSVGAA
jgi:Fe-S cluster assembly protein SufD